MNEQVTSVVSEPASTAAASSPEGEPDAVNAIHYRLSRNIVILSDPEGERAESIRALRAHLLAGHMAHGRRSLAICGAGPDSGATFLAVNLAVAFAKAGISTLLIDANLNDAGVSEYLRPDRPVLGLSEVLDEQGRVDFDNVQSDVLPNLSILYSGSSAHSSTEAFASREFKRLIDDCMRDHEITIVNTPAGHSAADVRRIAKSVRYALVVARKDHTRVAELRALVEELDSDRVNVIGTFLSDF